MSEPTRNSSVENIPPDPPQADVRLREMENQLAVLQKQAQARDEELAAAEAQRDEARTQLTVTENRAAAERLLAQSGVVDVETASLVLAKRMDFGEEVDGEALARSVEQLLLDKPFLRGPSQAPLPSKTASARPAAPSASARLAQTAERAARSGDRRDVAEYLRLRRQVSASRKRT
jgi:hypothetical protein